MKCSRIARLLLPLLFLMQGKAAEEARSEVKPCRQEPVRLVRTGPGTWFADFGKAEFGNVELTLPGGAGERRVVVHLGEALAKPETLNRKPGGCVRYQRHELSARSGAAASPVLSWSPPGWMKNHEWLDLPAGMPQVMPFRYVELEGVPEDLPPGGLARVSWAVPFQAGVSGFHSSSASLNEVWNLCEHSIKATTFMGIYVDGDRERRPYEADALINQLGHYCLDANYETARLTHEYLLATPTWPTEWRLQSVLIAWEDFLWSGDDSSLKRHYETLVGRAMLDRRTEDGWFRGFGENEPIRDIADWPAVERDGYEMRWPVKSAVTAFHYRALVLLEKIARHLGKEEDAAKFAAMAAKTREVFNRGLWNEDRGCYVDGLDPATGGVSLHASAHATFLPLALGLVPEDRVARCAAFLKAKGMKCSVYGAQFLLEALYEAGEADAALGLLESTGLRSWRHMMEATGSTITTEAWDPSLKPNQDWNHAWGAAPANLIPRKLMGIEPLEPGFKRFRIKPQVAGLEEAEVKLPTPAGVVRLKMTKRGGGWRASVSIPAGTVAEFHSLSEELPQIVSPAGVRSSRRLRIEHGRAVIELPAGDHELSGGMPATSGTSR